jgi:hypothetical protein
MWKRHARRIWPVFHAEHHRSSEITARAMPRHGSRINDEDRPIWRWRLLSRSLPVCAALGAHPPQVSRHRSFGDDKAELLNFAVDPRCSPRRVLYRLRLMGIPHFPVDPRPPTSGAGAPAPIETKTGTVPADDRFRFHDDENLAPAEPETPKCRPERSVEGARRRPRAFSFEESDLLAKARTSRAVSARLRKIGGENAMSHEMTVVTERPVGDGPARSRDSNH